ncbi:MAG: hypothetical protein H6Q93_329 [Nitrospirae bacterium]|jgi:hypothetical protein|nr:hypothetical protein [Nitrospirota bacterium]
MTTEFTEGIIKTESYSFICNMFLCVLCGHLHYAGQAVEEDHAL